MKMPNLAGIQGLIKLVPMLSVIDQREPQVANDLHFSDVFLDGRRAVHVNRRKTTRFVLSCLEFHDELESSENEE